MGYSIMGIFAYGEKALDYILKENKRPEWVTDKNGNKKLLSITKTPSLDKSGKVRFVVCSAKDITFEHRLEQQLRQNRNYLDSAILEEVKFL